MKKILIGIVTSCALLCTACHKHKTYVLNSTEKTLTGSWEALWSTDSEVVGTLSFVTSYGYHSDFIDINIALNFLNTSCNCNIENGLGFNDNGGFLQDPKSASVVTFSEGNSTESGGWRYDSTVDLLYLNNDSFKPDIDSTGTKLTLTFTHTGSSDTSFYYTYHFIKMP